MSEWAGKKLGSWEEFLAEVEHICQKRANSGATPVLKVLFRGDGNSKRGLETSLERDLKNRVDQTPTLQSYFKRITKIHGEVESLTGQRWDVPEYDPGYTDWIESLGNASNGHPKSPPGYEYLAYLRHHEFPSPLLDWSRSPFVAAYFAFARANETSGEVVSIYAYWEVTGNKDYGNLKKPLILTLGPHIRTHDRHFRQQTEYSYVLQTKDSVLQFVPHDSAILRCENMTEGELSSYVRDRTPNLGWKFNLPATEKWKVLGYLDEHNINGYTLLGSEDELVKTLAMRDSIEYFRNHMPPSRPKHEVVAAGVVQANQSDHGPLLGNLRIASTGSGEVVFAFDGYTQPDGNLSYIVKVHPVSAPPDAPIPTARFLKFRPEGFAVSVTHNSENVSEEAIGGIPFMVEVSRIA